MICVFVIPAIRRKKSQPQGATRAPEVPVKNYVEHKYVSYDAQLCPVIVKGQRAPNAPLTHQIVDRHHEELKFSGPDSQTLKNPF